MSRDTRKIFLFFSLLMILCACAPPQPKISESLEFSFREILAIEDVNNYFRIDVDHPEEGNFKSGSDIHVELYNLSDQQISFSINWVRLFIVNENEWTDIRNNNVCYGEGALLRPKSDQELGARFSTWVRPVLPSQIETEGKPEIVRIVAIGELMSDGDTTGIPVAAYTDVFVSP
jgi:hypothetical protein